jgi:hypothetical protein
MWIDGRTSKQIAETLGGVTRNAVMGMVNRMGLMGNQAHNSLMRAAHGACRPIVEEIPADPVETEPDEPLDHRPLALEDGPVRSPEPAPTGPIDAARPDAPGPDVATAVRVDPPRRRASLAARAADAPEVGTNRPAQGRADWRTAMSMVEEITGLPYRAGATGHRTSLVAISSILGGGDPRSVLPRDFPEPIVLRTMRSLAEKRIMVAGRTPEAWLDPEMGDFNFFVDMLVAEGVLGRAAGPGA